MTREEMILEMMESQNLTRDEAELIADRADEIFTQEEASNGRLEAIR